MWIRSSTLAWTCSAALVLVVAPECTSARTWHVEKDGSGDFTAIQPAIDAAAASDVIEIGPGRYTENAPFSPLPGSWVEPTYVGVTKENLTIRGTDRDAVIIGPTTPNFTTYGPKGIATHGEIRQLTVESLTVENVHDGMYLGADEAVVVRGCLLRACDLGVVGTDNVRPLIERCEFVRCREGVIAWTAREYRGFDPRP
jgi:pectin methylesterase-like acyl-CoA thioesterase